MRAQERLVFTAAEARAILIADEAFVVSYEARLACGALTGIEEREAWRRLVEIAAAQVTECTSCEE